MKYQTKIPNLLFPHSRYTEPAGFLYKELKKRGHTDNKLAHVVEDAVNRLVMEMIAVKLGTLARQL